MRSFLSSTTTRTLLGIAIVSVGAVSCLPGFGDITNDAGQNRHSGGGDGDGDGDGTCISFHDALRLEDLGPISAGDSLQFVGQPHPVCNGYHSIIVSEPSIITFSLTGTHTHELNVAIDGPTSLQTAMQASDDGIELTAGPFMVGQYRLHIGAIGTPPLKAYFLSLHASALSACGDGHVDFTEGCDDANSDPFDGCDASCQVEFLWECDPETAPSVCTPFENVVELGDVSPGDALSLSLQTLAEAGTKWWWSFTADFDCTLVGNIDSSGEVEASVFRPDGDFVDRFEGGSGLDIGTGSFIMYVGAVSALDTLTVSYNFSDL